MCGWRHARSVESPARSEFERRTAQRSWVFRRQKRARKIRVIDAAFEPVFRPHSLAQFCWLFAPRSRCLPAALQISAPRPEFSLLLLLSTIHPLTPSTTHLDNTFFHQQHLLSSTFYIANNSLLQSQWPELSRLPVSTPHRPLTCSLPGRVARRVTTHPPPHLTNHPTQLV